MQNGEFTAELFGPRVCIQFMLITKHDCTVISTAQIC